MHFKRAATDENAVMQVLPNGLMRATEKQFCLVAVEGILTRYQVRMYELYILSGPKGQFGWYRRILALVPIY